MYGIVNDPNLKSHGKMVEYWPNKLNRYMRHVRFQGSEKTYTMSKDAIQDVTNLETIEQWESKDIQMLNQKKIKAMNQLRKNAMQTVQYMLQKEVVSLSGINIVTCGDCGQVILHRTIDEEIECHECGFKSEPCDFPDLNY